MINVTKPFLPPIEEYNSYLEKIWERNWLTNNGPLVNELELKLKDYLGLNHLLFVTNGTVALQLAIKALGLKGEIITTPFSYVATTSSIVWENCIPVFADIDPEKYTIDPADIRKKITDKTTGIIATHVYGNACAINEIQKIAEEFELKVIYDAAHCFGTNYKGRSIFEYGDISTASFHATKLFHSVEGGAVTTNSPELTERLALMRNFGHNGPEDFACLGINGKNSEYHAAMGLVNLKYVEKIIEKRKTDYSYYQNKLQGLDVQWMTVEEDTEFNYSYLPILFKSEQALVKAVQMLSAHWVYPRRYFYPSLTTLNYVQRQSTPVADDIAKRMLCLPMFYSLATEEIDLICRLLLRAQNN